MDSVRQSANAKWHCSIENFLIGNKKIRIDKNANEKKRAALSVRPNKKVVCREAKDYWVCWQQKNI